MPLRPAETVRGEAADLRAAGARGLTPQRLDRGGEHDGLVILHALQAGAVHARRGRRPAASAGEHRDGERPDLDLIGAEGRSGPGAVPRRLARVAIADLGPG